MNMREKKSEKKRGKNAHNEKRKEKTNDRRMRTKK